VVREAALQVARPVVFAVAIITIVYLPILSLSGVEGRLFRPMALTVIYALLASLLLTLTLMPVLASLFLKGHVAEHESRLIAWVRRGYAPLLKGAERRPGRGVALALALLLGTGALGTRLGAEFIPRLDEGAFAVTITKLPSIGLDTAAETTTLIERTLLRFPEVETVISLSGSSEIPTDPMGVEQSDSFIMLRPHAEWTTAHDREGLIAAFSAALDREVPGLQLSWSQPIEMRMQDMLQGVRSDVALVIQGDDPEVLRRRAEAALAVLATIPGAADTRVEQTVGQPYLRVIIDREAVARYGLNAGQVLDVVEAMGGRSVGSIVRDGARHDIRVRLAPEDRADVTRIGELRISGGPGRAIPLSQLAEIRLEEGPAQISREGGRRKITVEANVRGRDIAGFVAEAQAAMTARVTLPPGYTLHWSGQFENLREAAQRLSIVVPAALILIFALLYLMFNSLRLAALIFLNVPFAATGGILALWLRGLPFSISAAVGFIALFGIAVLNGVVLVSTVVDHHRDGLPARRAAFEGAMQRLRPVLMTALVASLGFLPMAISTSAGAEVQRPLATVVIGGLMSATLLTLLVLPSLYPRFSHVGGRRLPSRKSSSVPAETGQPSG
jgi:cobalt-zinc-cadmium resistance protein CzcA